jgi:hypothetical protein
MIDDKKIVNFQGGGGCEVDPERVGRGGDGTCSILTDLSSLQLLCTGARLHWIGGWVDTGAFSILESNSIHFKRGVGSQDLLEE